MVADSELSISDEQTILTKATGFDHVLPRHPIQLGDVLSLECEHHRVRPKTVLRSRMDHESMPRFLDIATDVDATVAPILSQELADLTGAQLGESLTFPPRLLSAILRRLDDRDPMLQPVEHTAASMACNCFG